MHEGWFVFNKRIEFVTHAFIFIFTRNKQIKFMLFCFSADNQAGSDTKMTVEDLFKPEFKVHDPEAQWINGE